MKNRSINETNANYSAKTLNADIIKDTANTIRIQLKTRMTKNSKSRRNTCQEAI